MARILLGVLLGIVLLPVVLLLWLWMGKPPVAVADAPLPHEQQLATMTLHARIGHELPKTPVIQPDEDGLVAGAHVYSEKCVSCHGFHHKPSLFGAHMYPAAPPLWEKHPNSNTVGVSDDPPGETYWKVANGIRLTGMPAFNHVLSDTQMWQVTLLLKNADQQLPDPVTKILTAP